ncbi:GDP-perosamine synthase [Durusdinium trenchii]|uniref:GDP-perosamine synthase n=1 Tax=Durusdinium trenchii TaxID=1381693 RepID=A0ABP0R7Q3_9DINO
MAADGYTMGKMWNPSLYIGSILDSHEHRVAILPKRIKDSMPSPEPKPGDSGWLYRVLEPYYSRECVDNVMSAMLEGQISSGAAWPRKMVQEICSLYQVPVALPTSSGASALHVAFLACNLGPQDTVLLPALTMVAVANMVKMVGAKPIYCDCAEDSVNPGVPELLEKATPRTKAVIVCHTYGVACKDIVSIRDLCKEKGWWLVEDICEAMGTRADNGELVGTFGDFAVTSLYANKPITAGDGGWVHARDKKHHDRLKSLVNHGFDPAYHFLHFEVAPNAKMNGLGAAFVCSQVKTLPEVMQYRGKIASWYRQELADVASSLRCIEQRQIDAPWVFGVETTNRKARDELRDHLALYGIETRNYFYPLHLEPANFYGDEVGVYDIPLPRSEHLAQVMPVSCKGTVIRAFYKPDAAIPAPSRKHGEPLADQGQSSVRMPLPREAKRNDDLQEQLRSSRVEAQELREEMLKMREELHHAEARRLKELPKLKSELKQRLASQAEYHLQEVEEEARRRVAAAERHFHEQVRELEAQLDQARETNAQLGRKCFASYQATAQAEGTSRQSQFQSHQLQQDLQMLHGQCFRLQQEVQHQKALLHQEEATAANFKAQLERAESMAQHSEKASRELQEWMVRSLNEVNLSAHPSGEPRGRQFATEPSRAEMLESFRKGYQVRNGHGNRIRSR